MCKKAWLFFLYILLFLPATIQAQTHSWGAIVLLDEVENSFDRQGHEVWREHMQVQVLNRKGIHDFGEIVIPFSTAFQKLKVLQAMTILPDGSRVEPDKSAYNLVSPPFIMEAPIYSDLKYQTISMPALCPGAVIEYTYEIKTVKPFMKGEFWSSNLFQQYYPVKKVIYRLIVPEDKLPKVVLKHLELTPRKEKKGNKVIFVWEAKDLPAIDTEPNAPPLETLASRIVLSTINDWDKVAKWYMELAKGAFKVNKAIKDKTQELTKGLSTSWEKVKAIYNYVTQNIRYVGIEFGINGYKPHPATQVFRLRYGDCKDHSTLLIAMLRSVGIEAYPVLIPTSEMANLDSTLPMPGAFNHEIVAVKQGNKFIFLDSTAETTPCGELPPSDQGRKVLVIVGNKGIITKTPVFPASSNQACYQGKFKLLANGNLSGQVRLTYTGVYAMFKRYQFIHSTEKERWRDIEKTASTISPGAVVTDIQLSDYKDLNKPEVSVSFHLQDEQFATKTTHLLLFRPPVIIPTHLAREAAAKERKYPYYIGYLMQRQASVKIHLPGGYYTLFVPEEYIYENQVGSIHIYWEKQKNYLVYHSIMQLNQTEVPVELYPALRSLFNQAVKVNQNQVVILKQSGNK
ncbi:MAG: DUF3857 domain-containing protein [Candidatus Desulfofervidaceae bacterium]|nr:DUF3857 domain-containing protein [Candidatus Desulfofervidaceae bacterium]